MSKTIHKVTMELSIYLDEGTSDGLDIKEWLLQDGSVEKVIENAILAEIPCINVRNVIASEKHLNRVTPIEFYVMSVNTQMDVHGVMAPFSYQNTYTDYNQAYDIAEGLRKVKDTLEVNIDLCYLMPDGTTVASNYHPYKYEREDVIQYEYEEYVDYL